MIDPIGSTPAPLHAAAGASTNVPLLATEMRDHVTELAQQLQQVVGDPSLSTTPQFLEQFAANGTYLSKTVQEALMIR